MCFFFRKRKKKKQQEMLEKEQIKQEEVKEVKKTPSKQKANEETKKVEPDKTQPKKLHEEVDGDDDAKNDKVVPGRPAKYHVSQNKDKKSEHFKRWRVRKEGSQKTIKFFDTQLEAIKYAEDLADKAGSSIVIHKLDGTIRKQDYSK